jgi:hypothetical protein
MTRKKPEPGFIKPGTKIQNAFKIAPGLLSLATTLDTLKPDPNNANEHTPENLAAIKTSLLRFGQLKPIVITADRIIRAGNGTWLAAKELGAHVIAVVQIPGEWAAHAEEFALADNQSARLSRWNATKLKEAVERLRAAGGTPEALGFGTKELASIVEKSKQAMEEAKSHHAVARGVLTQTCPSCGTKFNSPSALQKGSK